MGIPIGYESDSDKSITISKHITEGCCRPDSPHPKVMSMEPCVNQPFRREEAII